jgi:hypothetical protein
MQTFVHSDASFYLLLKLSGDHEAYAPLFDCLRELGAQPVSETDWREVWHFRGLANRKREYQEKLTNAIRALGGPDNGLTYRVLFLGPNGLSGYGQDSII